VTTSGAHASSFVVLGAMTEKVGPSMVVMGDSSPSLASLPNASARTAEAITPIATQAELSYPTPGGDTGVPVGASLGAPVQISPSIIAMGTPVPEVSYEQIASITPDPPKPSPRPDWTPMVIRGGIVGNAFASGPSPAGQPTQVATQGSSGGGAQGMSGGSKESPIRTPRDTERKEPAAEAPPLRQPE
jgi:hypothetical protein